MDRVILGGGVMTTLQLADLHSRIAESKPYNRKPVADNRKLCYVEQLTETGNLSLSEIRQLWESVELLEVSALPIGNNND